ncbi:MFS transporter [Pseudomonas sp. gcc21]|uniref:MFS transporter n=1 Tax=Pseudomonas sp. gcc21 TaxID=2726989 RepID=UPI00145225FD|nr:MFS transporter [Pseudomonas sp. gcc21]QJD59283.1 MFS transporter [Pseudomonas sp. gcc21]
MLASNVEATVLNRNLLALTTATCAIGTQTFVFAGLLIELAADFGISAATGGYLAAAYALTYAITAPFIALRTGQLERRRLLWTALTVLGCINLLASLAGTFSQLIGLRILAGLAATLVIPVVPAVVASLFPPERRASALATVMGGMVIAFLFGMPAGSLIGGHFGWRSTFLLAAALCFTSAVAIRLTLPRIVSQDHTGWALLLKGWQPSVRRLLLMTLTAFSATFCVIPYIAPVMQTIIGSTDKVALSQMLVGVGAILGISIAGRFASPDRAGQLLTFIFVIIALTQLLYFCSMLWLTGLGLFSWLGMGSAVLLGSCALFTLSPLVQAQLMDAAPEARQVVMALNGSMMFLGQGAGAALGAQVTQTFSLPMIGLAGMLVAMIGLASAYRLQRSNPATTSQPAA